MMYRHVLPLFLLLLLTACALDEHGTIADLQDADIKIVDTRIDGGLEKAMKSYQQFLEQTPESAMTPEAIRRLADLNVEREYGVVSKEKTSTKEISKPKKASAKIKNKDRSTKTSSKIADLKSESTKYLHFLGDTLLLCALVPSFLMPSSLSFFIVGVLSRISLI